jgi:hypothetical protein
MCNVFDEFDKPVLRMDSPSFCLYTTPLVTVGTRHFERVLGCHVAEASLLHHLTETLTDGMCVRFDLVIMRSARTLLDRLDLGTDVSGVFENLR